MTTNLHRHRRWSVPLAMRGLLLLAGIALSAGRLPSQDRPPVRNGAATSAPLRVAPEQHCVDCHADLTEGRSVHMPVADQDCEICHPLPESRRHDFPPAQEVAGCVACHPAPRRDIVHAPFDQGNCTACHDPHHSEHGDLLRTDNDLELCGQCHEAQTHLEDHAYVHGPVSVGGCLLCHSGHSSFQPHLLLDGMNCLECHVDMAERLSVSEHIHPPVLENCALCHDPHASDHRFQLKGAPQVMCLDCHPGIRQKIESARSYHSALATNEGCNNCHSTHSALLPKLLKKPVDQLCMDCHMEEIEGKDGHTYLGIGDKLKSSEFHHGPIREGNCTACHDPHGTPVIAHLRNAYPDRFYAPYEPDLYSLCFGCHDVAAFESERTSSATGFRDGTRNLHYLHVHREKGRTCRACHDTHASNLPRHMRESVPFGAWEIPVNYTRGEDGGTCASGCHKPRSYSRSGADKAGLGTQEGSR